MLKLISKQLKDWGIGTCVYEVDKPVELCNRLYAMFETDIESVNLKIADSSVKLKSREDLMSYEGSLYKFTLISFYKNRRVYMYVDCLEKQLGITTTVNIIEEIEILLREDKKNG